MSKPFYIYIVIRLVNDLATNAFRKKSIEFIVVSQH